MSRVGVDDVAPSAQGISRRIESREGQESESGELYTCLGEEGEVFDC